MKKSPLNKGFCRRILKSAIVVVLCMILLLLFFIVFLIVLSNVIHNYKEKKAKEDILKKYRFSRISKKTNRTTTGFMTIGDIGESSFSEYSDSYLLISESGIEEYKCTGSCYCDHVASNQRKAATSSTLVSSVFFLVTAMTSYVAYEKAREYFSQECTRVLVDSCPQNAIRAEEEDCSPIHDPYPTFEDLPKQVQLDHIEEREQFLRTHHEREFYCSGRCEEGFLAERVGDYELEEEEEELVLRKYWKLGKCEEFELKQNVKYWVEKADPELELREAETEFMNDELSQFCIWETVCYIEEYDDHQSMCFGQNVKTYENPTVECVHRG